MRQGVATKTGKVTMEINFKKKRERERKTKNEINRQNRE